MNKENTTLCWGADTAADTAADSAADTAADSADVVNVNGFYWCCYSSCYLCLLLLMIITIMVLMTRLLLLLLFLHKRVTIGFKPTMYFRKK